MTHRQDRAALQGGTVGNTSPFPGTWDAITIHVTRKSARRGTPLKVKQEESRIMKNCGCKESKISFSDKRGNSLTAPVLWSCHEHREARRASYRAAQAIAREYLAQARMLARALPAPRVLLSDYRAARRMNEVA